MGGTSVGEQCLRELGVCQLEGLRVQGHGFSEILTPECLHTRASTSIYCETKNRCPTFTSHALAGSPTYRGHADINTALER